MTFIKTLSILLSISLGANFWFLYNWHQQSRAPLASDYVKDGAQQQTHYENTHAWTPYEAKVVKNEQNNAHSESFNSRGEPAKRSQADYLAWLTTLAKAREFEKLEFEVGLYLRLYPQDIEAMLLEAQAYYHNKPLSIALVHYHQLLSQALSMEQQNEVEKLIAVNTTRIIQQFSGDGAWNLLAQFLEPLVQIAPGNRQYLMGLASAYGMQSQFTLMEDVLASFPANDARAIRLRDSISARLNANANDVSTAAVASDFGAQPLSNERQADVLMQQQRGQFVTQALLHKTSAQLLVDTGASTTALSEAIFEQIDPSEHEFLGLFTVSTAGGQIQAPIYKINQITIGLRRLANTSVLILPSENLGQYDGLLGMNVLSQFDLNYDATTQTMRLYKKRQSY